VKERYVTKVLEGGTKIHEGLFSLSVEKRKGDTFQGLFIPGPIFYNFNTSGSEGSTYIINISEGYLERSIAIISCSIPGSATP
jgi:hypothetical protein